MTPSDNRDADRAKIAKADADKAKYIAKAAEAEARAAHDRRLAAEAEAASKVNATFVQTVVETLPSRDFMADMLASITTSNAALAQPVLQPAGVGIRMQRTRETFGFPTSRDIAARPAEARAVLFDALKRGFTFEDHDGVRTYRRAERLPITAKPAGVGNGPALRGAGLVQTEMLRAYCALTLQLLDDLPYRDEPLRDQIRGDLDDIVEIFAAPLGPTPGQGEGRFRRLVLAVADWLEAGHLVDGVPLRKAAASFDREQLLKELAKPVIYAPSGAIIPTREGDLRLKALYETLGEIGAIVTGPRKPDAGSLGAELEQAMTLLCTSAAGLRVELDRLGTSLDEQEVAFFGRHDREVSIAQFAGWVQDVCAAFATGDDEAPTLRREDLDILARDLTELVRLAAALERHAATYTAELRLVGARRQMKEVGYLLRRAQQAVDALRADPAA